MSGQWYDSRENLAALLDFLVSRDEAELEWKWINYYLKKPWKWQPEWEQFLEQNPTWKV